MAARLAELALDRPVGLVPHMAGPRVYSAAELLRGYLRTIHRHRPIIPVRLPAGPRPRSGAAPTTHITDGCLGGSDNWLRIRFVPSAQQASHDQVLTDLTQAPMVVACVAPQLLERG